MSQNRRRHADTQTRTHTHTHTHTTLSSFILPSNPNILCIHKHISIWQHTNNYLSILVNYHSLIHTHHYLSRFIYCLSLSPSLSPSLSFRRKVTSQQETHQPVRERERRGEEWWSTASAQPAKFENTTAVWIQRVISGRFRKDQFTIAGNNGIVKQRGKKQTFGSQPLSGDVRTLYCQKYSLTCLDSHMDLSDIPFLIHRVCSFFPITH